MPIQLRLRSTELADLQAIRELEPSVVESVVSHLREVPSTALQPTTLSNAVSTAIPDRKDAAEAIVRQGLRFVSLLRQRKLVLSELMGAIRHAVRVDGKWSNDEVSKWDHLSSHFESLLDIPVMHRVSKAMDVCYDYANLLQSTRIITDIRPVFDRDATAMEGAVVSFTMRLRFDSADGDHSLSIAMDEKDIRTLEEQCKRALKKASVAKRHMSEASRGTPTIISGETEADDAQAS